MMKTNVGVSRLNVLMAAFVVMVVALFACCALPLRAYASGVERLAGENRYATMEAITQESFGSADSAVLASGQNFPDALAASSLAGMLDCPILLTDPDSLSSEVETEIYRLGVQDVYIVGGVQAVSQSVEDKITQNLGVSVTRIAGADRYETALEIYSELQDLYYSGGEDVANFCIIATGSNFADALSISPLAYEGCAPIFLATDGELNADTLQAISQGGFSRAVIAGGTAVVSDNAQSALESLVGSGRVTRLAGNDRYLTSVAIAKFLASSQVNMLGLLPFSYEGFVMATGANYPDALCASSLCGGRHSVLLLVDWWHAASVNLVRSNARAIDNGTVVGGPNAVDEDTLSRIKNALNGSAGVINERAWLKTAKKMADDDSIGYSQSTRCLNPNVDCSSFVYYSLEKAGVELGQSWPFATYSMCPVLESAGFSGCSYAGMKDHLLPGDILVDLDYHTAIVWNPCNGSVIEAGSNDPEDGDQDGTEVCIDYWGYNCDYDYVYRL